MCAGKIGGKAIANTREGEREISTKGLRGTINIQIATKAKAVIERRRKERRGVNPDLQFFFWGFLGDVQVAGRALGNLVGCEGEAPVVLFHAC